jgi:hypothetical protein
MARPSGNKLYESGAHRQLTVCVVDGEFLLREALLLNNSNLKTYLAAP